MKKTYIFGMAMIIALAFASCGSEKKMTTQQPQQPTYQQQVQKQQAPQQQTATSQTSARQPIVYDEVKLNHCQEKALEESNNFRALGIYVSYDQGNALKQATAEARTELAQAIKIAVEGANTSSARESGIDQDIASKRLARSKYTQYVAEQVSNSPRIDYYIEQSKTDGRYQVYVCVEMKVSQNELVKNIASAITRDKEVELEYDEYKFEKEIHDGLEQYKAERKEAIKNGN